MDLNKTSAKRAFRCLGHSKPL